MQKLSFFEEIGYTPSRGQFDAHIDLARFLVILAGARFGKSMFAAVESAFAVMLPDTRIWLIGPTYDLAEKELIHALSFLGNCKINGRRAIDQCRIGNASRGSRFIKTPWNSFIITKSTEKLHTLLGEELDLAVYCEGAQIPRMSWTRYIRPRLGSRAGRLIATSTGSGDSGIFADFVSWGEDKKKKYKDWSLHQHSTLDNPTFLQIEWDSAKAELPKEVFDEQYRGKLVSVRGLVFKQFGAHNLIDLLPTGSEHWPIFLAWHHEKNASNNPLVCLICSVDPATRDLYVIDEHHEAGEIFADVAKEIRERVRGRRVIGNLTDYRNPTLKENLKILGSVSCNNEKAYPQKHALVRRIQALQTDLMYRENHCRIKILRSCKKTIEDFKKAKWPDKKPEQAEMAESEMPTTKYMPAPLALSYLVAYIKISSGTNIYSAQREDSRKKRGA